MEVEKESNAIVNRRENNFSFLHWTGIVLVMIGHQYVLMGYSAPRILGIECHNLGLRMLFVVSGYLVMESFKRTDATAKYLIKRAARIWPGLVICTLGTALLLGPVFTTLPLGDYFSWCKRYIISNILLKPVFDLPGVFADNIYPVSVNGSLWSLPVEVMCYFCIPILAFCSKGIKKLSSKLNIISIAVLVVFLYVMYVLREMGIFTSNFVLWGTDWLNAFSIIIYFAMGVVYSCFGGKRKFKLQWAILLIIVYMFMPGMLNVIFRPVVIAYFIFALAFDYPPILNKVTGNWKCYYSVYLWAFPIQQAFIQMFVIRGGRYINPLLLFVGTFVVVFFIAWFLTKYIEEPVSRLVLKNCNR